jgi:hypothetical protein
VNFIGWDNNSKKNINQYNKKKKNQSYNNPKHSMIQRIKTAGVYSFSQKMQEET